MAASGAIVKRTEWAARIARENCVRLWNQHLDADDASAIAEAISLSTTLEDFSFKYGIIASAAFPILAASLPRCETLKVLEVFDASIGEEGAFALSLVLPSCRALHSLNLTGNCIGNGGAVALAKALEQCSRIDFLSLGCCNVGDEGAVALAAALPVYPSLREIYLSRNHISDIGAKAIVKSVLAHKWLSLVYFDYNTLMSLEWCRACNHLNNTIKHLHKRTYVFSMLSIQLRDFFSVPRGLVHSVLFDMLRVGKLRGVGEEI